MKLNMNSKVIIFLCLTITTLFCINSFFKNESMKFTDEFLENIVDNKEYDMDKDNIDIYKKRISRELKLTNDINNYTKGYCALGYLEYVNGNYKEAEKKLLVSLDYDVPKKTKTQLIAYNSLSQIYFSMGKFGKSKEFFKSAEKIAIEKKYNDQLAIIYRSRARLLINNENGIGEAIGITEKALKLEQSYINMIEDYLLMSNLYILSNSFDLSIKCGSQALKIATEEKDKKMQNKCLINLGSNYYMQGRYKEALQVYYEYLEGNSEKNIQDELEVLGYTSNIYIKLERYDKADKIAERYIEKTKDLPKNKRDKELNWIYALLANSKVQEDNIVEAEEYLKKARDIYNKDKTNVYSNTDLWMDKTEINIQSKKGYRYDKILDKYSELLDVIDARGVKSDINEDILEDIIKLSKSEGDYHTSLFYTEKKLDLIKTRYDVNIDNTATYAISKFENDAIKEKIQVMRKNVIYIIIVIVFLITTIVIIYNKNRKIKVLNKELEELSIIDPLTGIYNKRYFNSELECAYKNKELITFIMLDIDYFKLYNDNYGHIEGDKVLKEIANILKETYKGDISLRYGGEEFSVISRKSREVVVGDTKKLIENIYNKNIEHKYSNISDRITVSVGIETRIIINEQDIDKLVRGADEKLYQSKSNGRNQYT